MFFYGFKFVKTLQGSIVTLIESPIFDNRDVVTIDFVCCIVVGLDGSGKDGSIGDIELISILM
jgi:hypothetical protein